jgi:hypothetical protein
MDKYQAEKIAEKELRFEIGHSPYLRFGDKTENGYIFHICYTPVKDLSVLYYPTIVGQLIVDSDGNLTRTSLQSIENNIEHARKAIEDGILLRNYTEEVEEIVLKPNDQ